jgi:hypothetical protein
VTIGGIDPGGIASATKVSASSDRGPPSSSSTTSTPGLPCPLKCSTWNASAANAARMADVEANSTTRTSAAHWRAARTAASTLRNSRS